jgi:S-layer homology domain
MVTLIIYYFSMLNFKKIIGNLVVFSLVFGAIAPGAHAAFSDVDPSHDNYQAITYLNEKGIISGYDDGTFKPDQPVNRAEAIKIIILPLFADLQNPEAKPFPDVEIDSWFAKFVQKGKDIGVVNGDGVTGNFEGSRTVNLAEYLKMILLAYNMNLTNYQNPSEALFNDIQDLNAWFVPYIHYAATTNIVHADNAGNIYPANSLTRGEVAEITYRLLINIQGGETQLYLSMAEAEMIKILQFLNDENVDGAESSAAKALQYSQSALTISPDEPLVQAAHNIAQAFDHLVIAYREGINENYPAVEDHASQAWNLANDAAIKDASVTALADSIKNIAHAMADSARTI